MKKKKKKKKSRFLKVEINRYDKFEDALSSIEKKFSEKINMSNLMIENDHDLVKCIDAIKKIKAEEEKEVNKIMEEWEKIKKEGNIKL